MNIIVRLLNAFAISVSTYAAVSYFAVAQEIQTTPQPGTIQKTPTAPQPGTIQKTPTAPQPGTIQKTPTAPQPGTIQKTPTAPPPGTIQKTPNAPQPSAMQKLCSFDAVDNLLPPPTDGQSPSPLSYLLQQGFTQKPDGSWVCYVRDSQKQQLYYTLFKVQQVNKRLIASSFLSNGSLIEGQETRTLDLFMLLVEKHTKTNQGNRQSVRRYFESFITLVKQGKIPASTRGYLFDQPNQGFIIYNTVTGGELQGTAITININSPQNLGSSPAS
ncbi:hypothetical protein [Brasilonema sp. UFV-L1]|uniref:hypothetical protein n=1 Tax=Brasilonema sp. UFV-L1 TaxID=2234130 RepID=UPI00145CA7E8|nr:hypothetical protein [Brasilonema sp. UFV-L1]NMG07694.1 hypothetical protein [Brasilonema sp. UFV-L1]